MAVPQSVTDAYQAAQDAYGQALASVGGNAAALDPGWKQGLDTAQAGYNAWNDPGPVTNQQFQNAYSNEMQPDSPFQQVVNHQTAGFHPPDTGVINSTPITLGTGGGVISPTQATTPSQASVATTPTVPSQAGTPFNPASSGASPLAQNPALSNEMLGLAAAPTLPGGTSINPTAIQSTPETVQDKQQLDTNNNPAATFTAPTTAQVGMQPSSPAAQVTPSANSQQAVQANQMVAAQMTNDPRTQTTAAQVTPSAGALATAAQGTINPNTMTMQGQMNDLMNFAPGQIPDWAKGAVTTAEQQMAARGLGASSMAGNAVAGAILQSALPIAQQDAQTYAQMGFQNLNNQQAAVLQNASTIANMDMANASFVQQAGIVNAQSFLQQDLSNLTNQQQAAVLNTQSTVQSIFSDQSAQNAAKQFNATSSNQVDQFYKSLSANVSQFNAAQTNNMGQFAASGNQAVSQFNAQLEDLRQRFNVQNAIQIDQSNVNWQRMINTGNTAATNAAQQTNATNMLGISNTALANLWQQALDEASHSFTASQNANTLQANVAMAALINNQNISNALTTGVGNFAANLLGNLLKTAGT